MNILHETIRILVFLKDAFIHILPFFALSVIIAAGVSQMDLKEKMVRFLSKKVFVSVVIATLVGAVSPLCACGVIPTLLAFLQIGIPMAAVMSFWITSPLMSPEAFLITYGKLGPEFAFVRLIAAIVTGLVAGYVTLKLFPSKEGNRKWLKFSLPSSERNCTCSPSEGHTAPEAQTPHMNKWKPFLMDLKKITLFLGGWLALAFLLEAAIKFYFPSHLIKDVFGTQNIFSVIWAAFIGIPLYINNISAVPIIEGLLQAGMGKGAALAFFLAGPVTTIPAMVAVFGLVKKKVFFTFVSLGLGMSIILGYVYELIP